MVPFIWHSRNEKLHIGTESILGLSGSGVRERCLLQGTQLNLAGARGDGGGGGTFLDLNCIDSDTTCQT